MYDFRPQFRWAWDGSRFRFRRVTAAPFLGEQWEQFLMIGVPRIEFGGDHNFGRLAPYEMEKIRVLLSKRFFIMSDHEQAGFKLHRVSMLDATLTEPFCHTVGMTDRNEFSEFMAQANRIHDNSGAAKVSTGVVDATTRAFTARRGHESGGIRPSDTWFRSLKEQPQRGRQPAKLHFFDTGPVLETQLNGTYKIFRVVYDPMDDLSNPLGHKCDHPFWCDYCHKVYQKEAEFTQHMMLHAAELNQQFPVGSTPGQADSERNANDDLSNFFDFDAYLS